MKESIWEREFREEKERVSLVALEREFQDTIIVGAGIAGLTTAYYLVRHGQKCTVIHMDTLSQNESVRSTAQINTVHDDGWKAMLDIHGEENIRLCYDSYKAAFDFIKKTITKENLDCEYEPVSSYLFAKSESALYPWIDEEIEAAKIVGVEGIQKVDEVPGVTNIPLPAIRYDNQAQFNPALYLKELRRILLESGMCKIAGNFHVSEINSRDGKIEVVVEDSQVLTCRNAVLATNIPVHTKLFPIEALAAYRSYVVMMKGGKPLRAQYWDNDEPYRYVRPLNKNIDGEEGPFFLVGGEDHRVGQEDDPERLFEKLIVWAKARFPGCESTRYRWSAQTIETFDGMPLLGRCSDNTYIITGDSGTGITHGTIGGILVAQQILDYDNKWVNLYNPYRSRTKSLSRWGMENTSSLKSYVDWVTAGEVSSESEIAKGEGAILRSGLHKQAIFKKEDGEVVRLCATCPHLGAVVRWNSAEKTWDCPAHGSRFTPDGKVIHGPAHCSLSLDQSEDGEGKPLKAANTA